MDSAIVCKYHSNTVLIAHYTAKMLLINNWYKSQNHVESFSSLFRFGHPNSQQSLLLLFAKLPHKHTQHTATPFKANSIQPTTDKKTWPVNGLLNSTLLVYAKSICLRWWWRSEHIKQSWIEAAARTTRDPTRHTEQTTWRFSGSLLAFLLFARHIPTDPIGHGDTAAIDVVGGWWLAAETAVGFHTNAWRRSCVGRILRSL